MLPHPPALLPSPMSCFLVDTSLTRRNLELVARLTDSPPCLSSFENQFLPLFLFSASLTHCWYILSHRFFTGVHSTAGARQFRRGCTLARAPFSLLFVSPACHCCFILFFFFILIHVLFFVERLSDHQPCYASLPQSFSPLPSSQFCPRSFSDVLSGWPTSDPPCHRSSFFPLPFSPSSFSALSFIPRHGLPGVRSPVNFYEKWLPWFSHNRRGSTSAAFSFLRHLFFFYFSRPPTHWLGTVRCPHEPCRSV